MRALTGRWFLKKKWYGGFRVIVETVNTTTCPYGLSESPEFTRLEKATTQDLINLDIKII